MDDLKALRENYTQVVNGALACLSVRLQHPCLILIYTLIDSLAWACSDKTTGSVRSNFEVWVETWLKSIPCTAAELYTARCAILHTLTSKAALNESGNVREIAYAWGTAKSEDLEEAISRSGYRNLVAVHIDHLLDQVCAAMDNILENAKADPVLKQRLEDAANQHLVTDARELVEQYLAQNRGA